MIQQLDAVDKQQYFEFSDLITPGLSPRLNGAMSSESFDSELVDNFYSFDPVERFQGMDSFGGDWFVVLLMPSPSLTSVKGRLSTASFDDKPKLQCQKPR